MKTVLALRALGLGDLLTALPALRGLADGFRDHRLVLAAPAWLTPLARLARCVDEVLDTAPLSPLHLAAARPDIAVNLHGRGPQSHRVLLATRPRRLISFAHPEVAASAAGPAWDPEEHEVARWCRLLRSYGLPADPERLDLDAPAQPPPAGVAGATLVHPGASSPARRWPPDRWGRVARAEAHRRPVFVTGGPSEVGLAREVARLAGLPPRRVLAGRTGVTELAAAVARAGRVVCGDTGVAHLATALGTPSVVLFGPTPPARWGPPPGRPQHVALWKGREGDPHAPRIDPGLAAIGVEEVLGALGQLDGYRRGRAVRERAREEVGL